MPAPGDQHQSWTNPYEEKRPRISEWTAKDIATISSKLDKQLGPEYISARAGPGGVKVHYLTAEKCITLANEVFGFNGWSSSIQNIQIDFADENPQTQRVSIGLSVIVRITLKDGTYHEDIGYGSIDNARGKAMAFEKAKKEGTTDGLKRALRSFGNLLGNCVYDKDYISQVVKMKANPIKRFDQNNLHRHSGFVKKEEAPSLPVAAVPSAAPSAPAPVTRLDPSESFEDFLGELDEADFCVPEDGHPDEIMLPPQTKSAEASSRPQTNNPQSNNIPRQPSGSNSSTRGQPQTPNASSSRHIPPSGPPPQRPNGVPPPGNAPPNGVAAPPKGNEPVAFFSARAMSQLPEASISTITPAQLPQQLFNPKAESPSIRRTPGIDHSSSKPLAKNGQHVAPSSSQAADTAGTGVGSNSGSFTPVRPGGPGPVTRGSSVANPSLDHTRRIGAPGGGGSPLANRGSYKPPTMKRAPLTDLPVTGENIGVVQMVEDGHADAKRQKMG